jgi:hypothetical protein
MPTCGLMLFDATPNEIAATKKIMNASKKFAIGPATTIESRCHGFLL